VKPGHVDVHDTGCGYRECPECGPLIELEIEAKHLSVVSKTYPGRAIVSEWLGDIYGSGQERVQAVRREQKVARVSRTKVKNDRRIKRLLTREQQAEVSTALAKIPLRKSYSRVKDEWLSEVWLELLNPTRLVANREARMPLEKRVKRAVHRAEALLRRRWNDDQRLVLRQKHLWITDFMAGDTELESRSSMSDQKRRSA
jgi:hypothetical protein